MISMHRKRDSAGWTLVELAVVLVITALLTTAAISLFPIGTQLAENEVAQQRMLQADQALVGFARAHNRLPFADNDNDGKEDIGAFNGALPHITLELPSDFRLAYSTSSALTSTISASHYAPDLPLKSGEDGKTVLPANLNGLDFCVALSALEKESAIVSVEGYRTAFALGHDALFDGIRSNELITVSTPNSLDTQDGSSLHAAIGIGELYARLDCPFYLSRAFSAAQAARSAQSHYLLARQSDKIGQFYIEIAQIEHDFNVVSHFFAALNLGFGAFELTMGIASGIPDILGEDAFAVAVAVVQTAVAIAQLGVAADELIKAEESMKSSEENLEYTRNQASQATAQLERITQLRDAAIARARLLDSTGLAP